MMNFIRGLSALILWVFCMVVAIGSLNVGYDLATTGQAATAGWCAFIAVASFVFGIIVPWWLIIPIINSHTSLKDE